VAVLNRPLLFKTFETVEMEHFDISATQQMDLAFVFFTCGINPVVCEPLGEEVDHGLLPPDFNTNPGNHFPVHPRKVCSSFREATRERKKIVKPPAAGRVVPPCCFL
jgi:hypothetical protein